MLKVYVAGAYSDDNVLGVLKNIGRGQYWAQKVFMNGMAPFTPWHDQTFVTDNWKEDFTVPMFYNYSMEWLRVSDVIFVVPNEPGLKSWEDSKGTLAEIKEAVDCGKAVIYGWNELLKYKKAYDESRKSVTV